MLHIGNKILHLSLADLEKQLPAGHFARCDIPEAGNQLGNRGFSTAGRPHKRCESSFGKLQVYFNFTVGRISFI